MECVSQRAALHQKKAKHEAVQCRRLLPVKEDEEKLLTPTGGAAREAGNSPSLFVKRCHRLAPDSEGVALRLVASLESFRCCRQKPSQAEPRPGGGKGLNIDQAVVSQCCCFFMSEKIISNSSSYNFSLLSDLIRVEEDF